MKIIKFEELECWKEARKLTNITYELTNKERFFKDFRLVSQITSAAISVMNNISEGFGSQSNSEFIRFLNYARRSTCEVQNCLYIALDQKYITKSEFDETYQQSEKVRKLIDGLIRYLKQFKPTRQTKPTQQTKLTKLSKPIGQ